MRTIMNYNNLRQARKRKLDKGKGIGFRKQTFLEKKMHRQQQQGNRVRIMETLNKVLHSNQLRQQRRQLLI